MNKTSSHVALGLTLLILFAILIVLNIYTPLLVDDYLLHFKISLSPLKFTDEPIRSFHELFTNMWRHRYILNGRMSNNLVMLLLYTVGKGGFNVLNSLATLLSLYAICKIALGKVTYLNILASCALAILLLPRIPNTVFWLAGSCNYVWVIPFICGVIFYLEQYFNKQSLSSLQTTILLSCTFIASSMHEASGVILCGMLILSILCQYRRKEPIKLLWWGLFVSIIGTSIPLSAPGIWHRASSQSPDILTFILHIIPNLIPHCWLSLSILLIYIYKQGISSILTPKGIFLLSSLACTLVFGSFGADGRGYFYMNLAILIFIFPWVTSILSRKAKISLVTSSLIILCASSLQFIEFKRFDCIIESEKEHAKNEKIFSLDIPLKDYNIEYIRFGTCYNKKGEISPKQYSIVQEVPEHHIVFNTIDFDKKIYSEFPEDPTDEPVVIKAEDICIIRLPKGEEPVEDSLNIENCGENTDMKQCFLFRRYTLWEKFLVIRKPNRTLSLYSIDYRDGFFYIILPEPSCHYHELTCSVSLPGGNVKKLSIDLDKTY